MERTTPQQLSVPTAARLHKSGTETFSAQEKLKAYWRLYEGLILPRILEEYWEEVWELRKNNSFPPHAIYRDVFQRFCEVSKEVAVEKPTKGGSGILRPTSVVMPCRWFWEVTLAIYYLLDHENEGRGGMQTEGYWERVLLDCVEKAEVDPALYENVSPTIWGWLRKLSLGVDRNRFWDNPIFVVYQCLASTWLEQAHNGKLFEGEPVDYLLGNRTTPEVTAQLNRIWEETERECKKLLAKPESPLLEMINVDME